MWNPFAIVASFGTRNWLWLTVTIVALDQWTKALISRHLELFESLTLLPVLDFMRLHNEGAAFSLLSTASGWQRGFFIAFALIASCVLLVWILRLPVHGRHRLAAALSLVMGGALGNVIDRIRLGHVVDFVRVHWGDWYYPAFNVADSAITVGAGLLILDTLLAPKGSDT
ncbi:MAG TPA: signal peptidase II [Gammaproteobacteria bacterium]